MNFPISDYQTNKGREEGGEWYCVKSHLYPRDMVLCRPCPPLLDARTSMFQSHQIHLLPKTPSAHPLLLL